MQQPAVRGVAYGTLNEGLGKVLRYGAYAPEGRIRAGPGGLQGDIHRR